MAHGAAQGEHHDDLRTALHRTKLDPHRLNVLTTVISRAIAVYRLQVKVALDKSAYEFAAAVGKALERVSRRIERRARAIQKPAKGAVSSGLAPHTIWTLRAYRELLPVLHQWQTAAQREVTRRKRPPKRPENEPLRALECAVADALDACGIAPTTTADGVFVRVLRDAVYPAASLQRVDAKRHAIKALQALAEWRTRPDAAGLWVQ